MFTVFQNYFAAQYNRDTFGMAVKSRTSPPPTVLFISLDVHDYNTFLPALCVKWHAKLQMGCMEGKVTNVIKMSILLILYLIFST